MSEEKGRRAKLPTEEKSESEELKDSVSESVDFKRKHVDKEKLEQKSYLRKVIYTGTERQLVQALRDIGFAENSPEWQAFINEFRKIRGIR